MDRAEYLRPSSAGTWSECEGFALLNSRIDAVPEQDGDNEVREDGTACHWLAWILWAYWTAEEITDENPPVIGQLSPNNRELTEEMFAHVEEYHGILSALPAQPKIEIRIPVRSIFPHVQDGTPDAWVVVDDTLYVWDLKYGFRPVEVWRNKQLTIYAWTLLMLHPGVKRVVLGIYQPRAAHPDGHARTWETTREELRPLAEKLQRQSEAAMAPNPKCRVNDHCGDCAAAAHCRALQAAAGAGMDTTYDATPHTLTDAELGYELTKLYAARQRIEQRIDGLSVQAEDTIQRLRRNVPGFGMSPAGTRYRWRDGIEQRVEILGSVLGVDVHAERNIKTVAQLREPFKRVGLDIESMYAVKPPGALRLKQTDPNEAMRRLMKRK